jgi:adenosylhomocysteine nucleosidase
MADVVTPGTPCLLFAIRRESMYFRRDCGPVRRLVSAPCPAVLAEPARRPLLVLETGIGRGAVEIALDWVFAQPVRPAFIVFAGFAGALDPALHVGDVVLADAVVDETGREWPATWPPTSSVMQPFPRRGRLLTAAQLVTSPSEKRRLGTIHHAHAVDMEAAYAAERCMQHAVPFGCVRAISDAADASVSPALVTLLSGSSVSAPRVLAALLRAPTLLGELWRLGRDTRLAARQLAASLRLLLAPIPR